MESSDCCLLDGWDKRAFLDDEPSPRVQRGHYKKQQWFYKQSPYQTITERQAVEEVLYLLMGCPTTRLFRFGPSFEDQDEEEGVYQAENDYHQEQGYHLVEGYRLVDRSPQSLAHQLRGFLPIANAVHQLESFAQRHNGLLGNQRSSKTLQAFSAGLEEHLHQHKALLADLLLLLRTENARSSSPPSPSPSVSPCCHRSSPCSSCSVSSSASSSSSWALSLDQLLPPRSLPSFNIFPGACTSPVGPVPTFPLKLPNLGSLSSPPPSSRGRASASTNSITLAWLETALRPHFEKLQMLSQLLHSFACRCDRLPAPTLADEDDSEDGYDVKDGETTTSSILTRSSFEAAQLLSCIYEMLITEKCYTFRRGNTQSCQRLLVLLRLLSITIKPFLDMLHLWLTYGQLQDPHSEFIIAFSKANMNGAETMDWEMDFVLRTQRVGDEALFLPSFFNKEQAQKALLAGKSMRLARQCSPHASFATLMDNAKTNLFSDFISALRRFVAEEEIANIQLQHLYTPNKLSSWSDEGPDCVAWMLASSEESERHDEPKHSNTLAFFHPSLLLESCLLPSLSLRYDAAHSALLKLLTEKYKLWDHMLRLRLAFFMQDASFYRELVPHLLQQLNDGDTITFGDQFELNLLLQDMLALYSTSFKLSSSLSVGGVEASLSLQLSNIRSHRLDDLRLRYNAPWPISLLLDNEVQEKYNKVWLLLLQIQKAKYGLDIVLRQLSFSGCTKGAAHHLHLLRAKMLHFVNSFQDYIMNRALEAVWVEYKPLFTKARTLDEILALHQRFLAKITDRCLLTERAASVMAAIKKALDVTGAFKRLSSASSASASVEGRQMNATRSLHELGDVFHQRVQLLCTVLQGVVKQQKSPHLEDLLMRLDFNGHYTSTRS